MAVIYRSDIKSVDAYAEKVLSNEVEETQTVITSVNSFIGDSPSKLSGKAWDKERNRMAVYIKALEKRKEVSTMLANAIKEANRIMEGYIAAFPWTALNRVPNVNIPKNADLDMIDSGWISEFQKALKDAKTAYGNAENSKNAITTKDKEGEELAKAKKAIGGYQAEMDSASAIIAACEEVIAYLEQLSVKDGEAYAKYSAAEAAIAELNTLLEDVEDLFAAPAPLPPKTIYVPIGGGGGSDAEVDDNSKKSGKDTTTPSQDAGKTDTGNAGVVTPITNTVTSSSISSGSNGTNNVTNTEDNYDDEYLDDELIDDEIVDEGPIIGDDTIPDNDNTITPSGGTAVRGKDNTLKKVGIGLAGAAVAGAVGYGAYKAAKSAKENNEIEEEADEENDTYNDYSDDFEIKTNEDDKV